MLQALLLEFDDVVNPSKPLPPFLDSDVFHHIKTFGLAISSKFCHLDGEKLEAARKEFKQLDRDGIVRPSDSPWSSPLHMVWKADGSLRPCGDFWRLIVVNMNDLVHVAVRATIFSKIDLRKGYHQIPYDICKMGHHSIWFVQVHPHAVWSQECQQHLSTEN